MPTPTAERLAAKHKLTRDQKALIHLAQRCQHAIDAGREARDARDGALRQLAAQGVPAVAIYTHPEGKGRARLAVDAVTKAIRARR